MIVRTYIPYHIKQYHLKSDRYSTLFSSESKLSSQFSRLISIFLSSIEEQVPFAKDRIQKAPPGLEPGISCLLDRRFNR